MNVADLSIITLLVLFLLGMLVPRAHLGLAAFAASFVVAGVAGVSSDELVMLFPSDFFILIVGVMALFAIAQTTGAMIWALDGALRLVGGRVYLIPILPFLLGAFLVAVGTLPAAAIALMAPIALGLARRYSLPPFLMAFTAISGVIAANFSPVAVLGITTNKSLEDLDISLPEDSSVLVALAPLVVGLALAIVACLVFRTAILAAHRSDLGLDTAVSTGVGTAPPAGEEAYPRWVKVASLLGLGGLVLAGVVFDLNLGYTGFLLAFVLVLIVRVEPDDVIKRIPWGVVVLIGGLLTYVGLMQELGAFERLSDLLTFGDSTSIALLVLLYIASITSFFANSIAVIVATLPLLPPLVEAGVEPVPAVLGVLLACTLVDLNPLGITGGLILASTAPEDRQRLFRQLLGYGIAATLLAPLVLWLAITLF